MSDISSAYLTERQAASFLGVSVRLLQRGRYEGFGPAFVRLGRRRLAYPRADLETWLAARRFHNTSEETAHDRAA